MWRILRTFICTIALMCPACSHGRMFRSFFTMNVRCPACGVIFERDGGEVTGAMAINITLTMFIAIMGSAMTFFTRISPMLLLSVLSVVTVLFPLWFYRYSRALWVGVIYLTGSMFEE